MLGIVSVSCTVVVSCTVAVTVTKIVVAVSTPLLVLGSGSAASSCPDPVGRPVRADDVCVPSGTTTSDWLPAGAPFGTSVGDEADDVSSDGDDDDMWVGRPGAVTVTAMVAVTRCVSVVVLEGTSTPGEVVLETASREVVLEAVPATPVDDGESENDRVCPDGPPKIASATLGSKHPSSSPAVVFIGRAKHLVPTGQVMMLKAPLTHSPRSPWTHATWPVVQADSAVRVENKLLNACAFARLVAYTLAATVPVAGGADAFEVGRLGFGVPVTWIVDSVEVAGRDSEEVGDDDSVDVVGKEPADVPSNGCEEVLGGDSEVVGNDSVEVVGEDESVEVEGRDCVEVVDRKSDVVGKDSVDVVDRESKVVGRVSKVVDGNPAEVVDDDSLDVVGRESPSVDPLVRNPVTVGWALLPVAPVEVVGSRVELPAEELLIEKEYCEEAEELPAAEDVDFCWPPGIMVSVVAAPPYPPFAVVEVELVEMPSPFAVFPNDP